MMLRKLAGRIFLFGIVFCLLAASLNVHVERVLADDGESTASPTVIETVEIIPSNTTTSIAVETATPEQLTSTLEVIEAASQTPIPTFTAAPRIRGKYISDEVLARFKNTATDEDISACLERVNGHIDSSIEELNVTLIKLDSVSVSNAVATLSACEGVRYVEPNYLAFSADTIPTDTGWPNQYGLVNIRAPQGWDLSRGSASVVIAIVDTGVDLSHPDLAAKIVAGFDFVNNDSIAQDDNGHGTHVAGIAAAISNNGTGIAGVSWGARIMPVKVLNAAGGGTFANVAAGIIWAADHGAQIINLSVGGPSSSLVLQNAVNYAFNQGVLIIAASGNSGSNLVLYPAAYPNVIAVGATDILNNVAGFSNHGSELDLVAPGVNIYSTSPSGYTFRNGTSMSTAFVSGFAAILRGIPGNSAGSVWSIMESTALDLGSPGWDSFYGNGLIQMDSAILLALPPNTTTKPKIWTSQVLQPESYFLTATHTPSATITLTSSLQVTETPTAALPSPTLENTTLTNPPTPEIIALDTRSGYRRDLLVPSCGLLLILLGILLFWLASKPKKKPHHGSFLSR